MGKIRISLKGLLLAYLFAYWMSPNYFALKISSLPLMTLQRILVIPIVLWILLDKDILSGFLRTINKIPRPILCSFALLLCSYFVTSCIAGWNNIFNSLFDVIIPFFVIIHIVYYYFDFSDIQRYVRIMLRILCVLGIFEAITQINVFTFLDTGVSSGLNNGGLLRDVTLRICTAYGHPLAYSMILNIFFPLICYDVKAKKIDIFRDLPTFCLVTLNVLLTGSRSGIMLFVVEFVVLFLASNARVFLKNVFVLLLVSLISVLVIEAAKFVPLFESLMRSFLYSVDALLHTNYASAYGGNPDIANSSTYRDVLWNIMLRDEYFTWFGKGNDYTIHTRIDGWFIESIDNYYINQYLRFGVIGLIAIVFMLLSFSVIYLKEARCNRDFSVIFLLIVIVYISNLFVVDELGTLRFMISVLAVGIASILSTKVLRKVEA